MFRMWDHSGCRNWLVWGWVPNEWLRRKRVSATRLKEYVSILFTTIDRHYISTSTEIKANLLVMLGWEWSLGLHWIRQWVLPFYRWDWETNMRNNFDLSATEAWTMAREPHIGQISIPFGNSISGYFIKMHRLQSVHLPQTIASVSLHAAMYRITIFGDWTTDFANFVYFNGFLFVAETQIDRIDRYINSSTIIMRPHKQALQKCLINKFAIKSK